MIRAAKLILLILFSTGWIAPFTWSIWIIYVYIRDVVWPQAHSGRAYNFPFHFFDIAHYVFFFSLLWLFIVIVYWIVKLFASR